jgi:hypothetical protein
LAVAINVETYVDAPEFRRIEPDGTAIATASPATGTGAFVAAADEKTDLTAVPNFGFSALAGAAAACVFDVAALVVAEVVGSGAFTAARSLVAAAAASDGGAPTSSGSTPWL